MANPPDQAHIRDIRDLARGLAEAPDGHVSRVVELLDQLPNRGQADQLIAPLRGRLARLRPPRPMRLPRLLFQPLESLVVPAPRWRPNLPVIPRTILGSLAATVRAGLGAEAAQIDALLHDASSPDGAGVIQARTLLWPKAAALLMAPPTPVGWTETGLNPALYPPLARRVGAVLRQGLVIEELIAEAAIGIAPPRQAAIRAMLADVETECRDATPMLVALLLGRLPQCAPLLGTLASELGPQVEATVRQAGQEAAEALLAGLETADGAGITVGSRDLAGTVQEVRRIAALLKQLADCTGLPQLHPRLQAVRQRLDAGCRQVFAHALATEFLPALHQGGAGGLETLARHLRELECDARPLGGGELYDAQLRQAAAAVGSSASLGALARVRLVEILAGPEAAVALLGQDR